MSTVDNIFNQLNEKYNFNLNVCKDKNKDSLAEPWNGTVWCNPVHQKELYKWVYKAKIESMAGNTVVMLLPARTGSSWFHEYILTAKNATIEFIRGRLKFDGHDKYSPESSMIVVFNGVKQNG